MPAADVMPGRQLHHASGLVAHGAQRLLEDHFIEAIDVGIQRHLQILVVEELRVVEAGGHHALVAVDDGVLMGRVAVGDDDELVGELAVGVVQREVALVHEHGVDDDLLGNLQELLVEGAHHGGGVLGEVDDLGERLGRQIGGEAGGRLDGRHALADDRLAGLLGGYDVGALHHGHEVVGRGHGVRAGGQEAMAARLAIGNESRVLHGNHRVTQKRHQPAHRAREHLGRGAPAAGLRPGDAVDDAAQHLGQQGRHILGGNLAHGVDVLGAVLVAALERVHVEPLAAAKPMAALVGLPASSKAILAAGPRKTSSKASVRAATSVTMAMRRRGLV